MILLGDDHYNNWAAYVQGGMYAITGAIGWHDWGGAEPDIERGSRCPDDWWLEEMIEEGVSDLAREKRRQADCIRIHYGASRGHHLADSIRAKAKFLKTSEASYYRWLDQARKHAQNWVDDKIEERARLQDRLREGKINL